MMTTDPKAPRGGRFLALAGLCLVFALGGCGLDKTTIPDLSGPSELGVSFKLEANPDILTADGFSTSAVTLRVRDQNGNPKTNYPVFFAIADSLGNFADIGSIYDPTGVFVRDAPNSPNPSGGIPIPNAGAAIARTDGSGVAQVIYKAPVRTDFTADQRILIMARPVGDDARAAVYRSVALELRSAEPRLYPQNPNNCAGGAAGGGCPRCNFVVEPSAGPYFTNQVISFQDASTDTPDATGHTGVIVRYEWFFGDGSGVEYHPNEAHIFRSSGFYSVTHVVTDDNGAQAACAVGLTVN